MDTIQECIGWVAGCLSACFYIYQIVPFINVIKGKIYFENSPGVFVTTCYVNCFLWYIYGDMIFSDQIKISNCIGACVTLLLITIYLLFEIRVYLVDTILNALILITGSWAIYRALTIIVDDDRTIGKLCIASTIFEYLTPIQIIYKVLKEKYYVLIEIYPCWINLSACISWVIYGILITDFYVVLPHIFGIIIYLMQIVIFINYKKKYPSIGEKDFSSTIGIETTEKDESKKDIKIEEDLPKPVKIINKNDN